MTDPKTRECVVCGEEVDADLPGWAHGDAGSTCPGCVASTSGPSSSTTLHEYCRGSDGYERCGGDMTPWVQMGEQMVFPGTTEEEQPWKPS